MYSVQGNVRATTATLDDCNMAEYRSVETACEGRVEVHILQ
jgi:hypothetical protein